MKVVKTTFQEIHDAPDESCCLRCLKPSPRVWTATRFAIDASKERQGLLKIVIGVYRCTSCRVYFRSNPKFIKPRFLYTNKIINAAVAAAVEDKMPISRIPHRLERDFGVRPTESAVREWIEKAAAETAQYDVLPIAVREFSGVLCIDEAYSGKLAILIAVDPKNNDRLVGFDLSDQGIDQDRMKDFLNKLKIAGISPEQVITDGSALYPCVVKDIWPGVQHQLCLFHVTQRLTDLAKKAIRDLKKQLPKRPKANSGYATDLEVTMALELYRSGTPLKQIARMVGVSRNSIKVWIKNPKLVADRYGVDVAATNLRSKVEKKPNRVRQKISNQVPEGWSSWDQVDTVSTALTKLAFQISLRTLMAEGPPLLHYNACLDSPLAMSVQAIRRFIEDWYDIFTDGVTSSEKWKALKHKNLDQSCARFSSFQKQMSAELYEKLSVVFKSEKFEKTSNGAERFARKVKRIQKSRYRLRTEKSLRDFIVIERILHESSFKYGEMDHPHPLKTRLS